MYWLCISLFPPFEHFVKSDCESGFYEPLVVMCEHLWSNTSPKATYVVWRASFGKDFNNPPVCPEDKVHLSLNCQQCGWHCEMCFLGFCGDVFWCSLFLFNIDSCHYFLYLWVRFSLFQTSQKYKMHQRLCTWANVRYSWVDYRLNHYWIAGTRNRGW